MAIIGTESIFYIKDEGLWKPISCEVSSPMTESVEMLNTTTRDNAGWKTEKPTMQMYSISIEAVLVDDMDFPAILSYSKLREKKRNRELIEWKRELLNGLYIDYGKAHITTISDANTVGEEISFSMELNGFGKPLTDTARVFVLGEDKTTLIANNNNLIETK